MPAALQSTRNHLKSRLVMAAVALLTISPASHAPAEDEGKAFFNKKIGPVLVKNCYECHSAKHDKFEGGLGVDTRKAIRSGGDRGPAVVPNSTAESLIIRAIKYSEEDLQMPPDGKLSNAVIADFEKWINMGAPDPREAK